MIIFIICDVLITLSVICFSYENKSLEYHVGIEILTIRDCNYSKKLCKTKLRIIFTTYENMKFTTFKTSLDVTTYNVRITLLT